MRPSLRFASHRKDGKSPIDTARCVTRTPLHGVAPGVLVSALFLENFAPPFPEKEVRMGYGNVPQSGAGLHQTQIRVYLRSASKRNQCAWPERCQTGKLHGFKETGVIEDEGQYLQDGSYRRSFVSSASRRLCSHGAVNDSV